MAKHTKSTKSFNIISVLVVSQWNLEQLLGDQRATIRSTTHQKLEKVWSFSACKYSLNYIIEFESQLRNKIIYLNKVYQHTKNNTKIVEIIACRSDTSIIIQRKLILLARVLSRLAWVYDVISKVVKLYRRELPELGV